MAPTCSSVLHTLQRSLLCALALGTAAGLLLEPFVPGSRLDPHWLGPVRPGPLGSALGTALAGAFATLVLAEPALRARWPRVHGRLRLLVGLGVAATAMTAFGAHILALEDGHVTRHGAVPPTTLVAALLVVPWALGAPAWAGLRWPTAVSVAAAGLALTSGHLAAVGATGYARPADAILVLGARVHADGTPSGALGDRTRAAIDLWKRGLAPRLLLSGGRDAGARVSEPEAMRRLALEAGVPEEALVLDESGATSERSIAFAAAAAGERGWRRVLVVSHDYHLARLRLLAGRAGLEVATVPARESHPWPAKPWAVAREVVAYLAWWACLVR